MFKYSIIIHSKDHQLLLQLLKTLETQKILPEKYLIVYTGFINDDILTTIMNYLNFCGRKWKFKIPSFNETLPFLIDEFFKTKQINTTYSLVLDSSKVIEETFIEKLTSKIDDKKYWIYEGDNYILFATLLCKFFTFEKIKDGLIAYNLGEKIYSEYSNTRL